MLYSKAKSRTALYSWKIVFAETLTAFTDKTVTNQKGANFEKKKLETADSRNLNHTAGYPFYNNDMEIFPK